MGSGSEAVQHKEQIIISKRVPACPQLPR